jgi:tetraacyldisaccharide 4'-kinase
VRDWLETEWQRESPAQLLLRPLSWMFALLAALRRVLFRLGIATSHKLPVPVIVVGNISVGGTGKTPLTIALAEHLLEKGWRPGIVSRGYGAIADDQGRHAHVEIRQGGHPPDWFGDEPLIMAARLPVPVYVGAERAEVARALLKDQPQVNVILSDDGLQHYAMERDVEIAVVDGERGFGNGHLLPAGPLRERPARLKTVNAIVVNGAEPDAYVGNHARGTPGYSMRLGNERFVSLSTGEEYSPEEFLVRARAQRIVAMAGIGHPKRFFQHLRRLGIGGVGHGFPDHHRYTQRELKFPDADLILMTEKDAVKCRGFADHRMWFMRVDAQLPDEFFSLVDARLRPH